MREAREIMAELAASGLKPEQIALIFELSASVAAEARPAIDQAAENKRAYDREYHSKRRKSRTTSYESHDTNDPPKEDTSNPQDSPVEPDGSTAPKGRIDRGAKISEGWEPPAVAELSPEARSLASQWPAAAYRAEAEAFRNFWLSETGKSARKSDWNRAWANRIVAINGRVQREWSAGRPRQASDLEQLMASVERKYGGTQATAGG